MFAAMKYILCFLIVLAVSVPTLAQTPPSDDPRHAPCFKKLREKPDWGACEELIPQMVERHLAGEKISGFISCVPEGTDLDEVRKTFDAWISKRPHFKKYTAWDTLSGGLSVLYRCVK